MSLSSPGVQQVTHHVLLALDIIQCTATNTFLFHPAMKNTCPSVCLILFNSQSMKEKCTAEEILETYKRQFITVNKHMQ
jgi:hypothetical protein